MIHFSHLSFGPKSAIYKYSAYFSIKQDSKRNHKPVQDVNFNVIVLEDSRAGGNPHGTGGKQTILIPVGR